MNPVSIYDRHLSKYVIDFLNYIIFSRSRIFTAVLKKAGSLMPGMLIQEVENTKHKHRSKKYCDELVSHLQQFSTTS